MDNFNINDYTYQESEDSFEPKKVEYSDFENRDLSQYSEGEMFSFRERPDMAGKIKRVEDGQIVFSMFDQTYIMPEGEFGSLFFLKNIHSPQNWYT